MTGAKGNSETRFAGYRVFIAREFRQAFWSRGIEDGVSLGGSKPFWWTPALDAKAVADVFHIEFKTKRPSLLSLCVEPPIDECGIYPSSTCPSFSRGGRREARPFVPDFLQGGSVAVSQGTCSNGYLLTCLARSISAGAHDGGGDLPISDRPVISEAQIVLVLHSHQSWPTVNLKQLFHHSRRQDSSGHVFYVHSSKLLETSVKMAVPIVKRSFRFVPFHSGHINPGPPSYADERLSRSYPVVHFDIF